MLKIKKEKITMLKDFGFERRKHQFESNRYYWEYNYYEDFISIDEKTRNLDVSIMYGCGIKMQEKFFDLIKADLIEKVVE